MTFPTLPATDITRMSDVALQIVLAHAKGFEASSREEAEAAKRQGDAVVSEIQWRESHRITVPAQAVQ